MWVAKRKTGEDIVVEGEGTTTIQVLAIHRGEAVLGVNAPRSVRLRRGEQLKRRNRPLTHAEGTVSCNGTHLNH